MGIFDDVLKQANDDMGKVVDALQGFRKRALAKCSTCGDTGVVQTAKGETNCHCEAGRVIDEKKRLPR